MTLRSTVLALLLCTGLASCAGEPPLAPFPLAASTREACAGDAQLRARLEGHLVRLFGQPESARYRLLPPWREQGFDPNAPAWGALDGDLLVGVRRDNRARYHDELARLAEGELPARLPKSLERIGEALAEEVDPERWIEALETFHPSLPEAARSYSRQCVSCHGVAGRGDGPSSHFQNPPPRDYGAQEFKHFPAHARPRPGHLDLIRVQREGIAGSGMPRFSSRPLGELSGMADYVRLLAIRAEVEEGMVQLAERGSALDNTTVEGLYAEVVERWRVGDAPTADG